jgi:4'-phosphopantetheinyl transferase
MNTTMKGLRCRALAAPWPELRLSWIDLDATVPALQADDLSRSEWERAARFRFERDRRRFLVSRMALREVLAAELGCSPREIRLELTPTGKPILAEPAKGLHFNLSHSAHHALVGVSRAAPVGVDIEILRPLEDVEALARAHFDDQECAALLALPAAQRMRHFLRVWARKEACLKAWGAGLGWPPREVAVGLGGARMVQPPPGREGAALRLASVALPENAGCEAAASLGLHGSSP